MSGEAETLEGGMLAKVVNMVLRAQMRRETIREGAKGSRRVRW